MIVYLWKIISKHVNNYISYYDNSIISTVFPNNLGYGKKKRTNNGFRLDENKKNSGNKIIMIG